MRRFHRETAAAFGDAGDRDVEAEFGALAHVSTSGGASAAGKASVQPPTLRVVAPPAPAKPVPPKPAAKATYTTALTTPKPSAKVPTVAAPARPAPAAAYASDANRANFIDGGGTPISLPVVKVPAGTVTMTQAQRDANARAVLKADTLKLAAANAPYARDRQANDALALASLYDGKKESYERAGIDVGQIVMGAKVLAVGATVIATGGAVAGAVGITAGGASLATAAAADRLVAAVEKGGELGKQANQVIADVKGAAAKGDKAAKDALAVVNAVASGRVTAGIAAGVEQTLTAAGKDAANAVAGIALGLSGSGALSTSSVAANLAAAAGKAPSSPYVDLRPQNQVQAVSTRPPPKQLTQFDFGEETPRWLVTPEGRVVDLKRTPSKVTAKGFIVTAEGDVHKQ